MINFHVVKTLNVVKTLKINSVSYVIFEVSVHDIVTLISKWGTSYFNFVTKTGDVGWKFSNLILYKNYIDMDYVKKEKLKIRIDPKIMERVQTLDRILNRHRSNDRHGKVRDNISMSEYWEGIIKEHLNSKDVIDLMRVSEGKLVTDGSLE